MIEYDVIKVSINLSNNVNENACIWHNTVFFSEGLSPLSPFPPGINLKLLIK